MFRREASSPIQLLLHDCRPVGFQGAVRSDRQLRTVKRRGNQNPVALNPEPWSAGPAPEPELCSCFLQFGESRGRNWRKAHAIADGEKTHGLPGRTTHLDRSASDYSPAAGRSKRIHAGLVGCDSHAASRRASAWAVQTRRSQSFRQFAEIRKSRNESEKINYVRNRGDNSDYLCWRHPV